MAMRIVGGPKLLRAYCGRSWLWSLSARWLLGCCFGCLQGKNQKSASDKLCCHAWQQGLLVDLSCCVLTVGGVQLWSFGAQWLADGSRSCLQEKIRKVLNESRAAMHGSVIDVSSAAAVCKPWDKFGLEACVCASSLDIAGALCRGKIRKVLNENRAWMHVGEIDTSNEAAACNSWDELGWKELVLKY